MSPQQFVARHCEYSDVDIDGLVERLTVAPRDVSVVIPVHNAPQAVQACLESVVRHGGQGVDVIVVDDASSHTETVALLDWFATNESVRLIRHADNQGFTRSANRGIAEAGERDVILLNSDTEVGPLWWQRLRWVAYSHDRVATVSAVSDNAGRASVPVMSADNTWYPDEEWDVVARLMASQMYVFSQQWPIAAGFCMYLRRDALHEVGGLDEDAFPRGYGEEIDFAQRAMQRGFVNLLAPHVLVKHQRSDSFGDSERMRLVKRSTPVLRARYPSRMDQIVDWATSPGNYLIRSIAARVAAHEPAHFPPGRTGVARPSPLSGHAVIDLLPAADEVVSIEVPLGVGLQAQRSTVHAVARLALDADVERLEIEGDADAEVVEAITSAAAVLGLPCVQSMN